MENWERFLEKFSAFGSQPSAERYLALFDPEGCVQHPGMPEPIGLDRIPDFITRALARMTEFRFTPIHWSASGNTLFVEAQNTARPNGQRIAWPSIYRVKLRGDRVLSGRAFYDRTESLAAFDPALATKVGAAHASILNGVAPRGAAAVDRIDESEIFERILKPYAANWQHPDPERFKDFYSLGARMINPGFERPLKRDQLAEYYVGLKAGTPDLTLRLEGWACAPGLLYAEWTACGTFADRPLRLPVVDRFTLRDSLAVEGVAYFDALAMRAMADSHFERFNDASVASAN